MHDLFHLLISWLLTDETELVSFNGGRIQPRSPDPRHMLVFRVELGGRMVRTFLQVPVLITVSGTKDGAVLKQGAWIVVVIRVQRWLRYFILLGEFYMDGGMSIEILC